MFEADPAAVSAAAPPGPPDDTVATEDRIGRLIDAAAATVEANAERLTDLDRAIGDGDHGVNLRRGFREIAAQGARLAVLSWPEALHEAGMILVLKVGGASGPLYGSLLMAMGKAAASPDGASGARLLRAGVEAVARRGRAAPGEKTMLDVLEPVARALEACPAGDPGGQAAAARAAADQGLAETAPMRATKGRASYLGERSIGHLDPGAQSACLLVHAACDVLAGPA